MKKIIKLCALLLASAAYVLILRYVAPGTQPFFFLGILLIICNAWLYGMAGGLATAIVLPPATTYIYDQLNTSLSFQTTYLSYAYLALTGLVAICVGLIHNHALRQAERIKKLEGAKEGLQNTLSHVKELGGIHSICASCHKIQNDDEAWVGVDVFLKQKTKMDFSHGICPDCAADYTKNEPPPPPLPKPDPRVV